MAVILYSYRRCPYAMRARSALILAQVIFEVREISLRNKPPSFLAYSPKGTVPVLVMPDQSVIDQSLDIMTGLCINQMREITCQMMRSQNYLLGNGLWRTMMVSKICLTPISIPKGLWKLLKKIP